MYWNQLEGRGWEPGKEANMLQAKSEHLLPSKAKDTPSRFLSGGNSERPQHVLQGRHTRALDVEFQLMAESAPLTKMN